MTVVADARRFADMHALYRMFDENGRLLYVGITGDLARRLTDHEVKRWYPLIKNIVVEWFPHEAAARVAERRAISTERPRYNVAGLKPPKQARRTAEPEPELVKPRNLLADLDAIVGSQRVRLADLPPRLRALAPEWEPYRSLNGLKLREQLEQKGVRTTNAHNVPRLDPVDLRVVLKKAG